MSTVNNITYEQVAAVQEPTSSSSPAPQPTSTLNGGSALANALAWLQNNPIYDPTSTIELKSPPPDGLNTDPRDCFGVSSNPDVAEQQLLDLMEWTREGGFDKRNCALIWVCAMIGFDMRINQWNAEGLGNDPSVLTIESTLADLTNVQDDQGQSLSDMVVQNLAAMVLYGAYDHNGGNVAAANQTVIKALTMANDAYLEAYNAGKISNPVLTSFDDSVQTLLYDQTAFNTWESQYLVDPNNSSAGLINGDLSFSEQCVYLSEDVNYWCTHPSDVAENNLSYVEGQSRSAWVGNMIDAGDAVIYVICLLLMAVMSQYYIDAGSVQAELDLYSGVTSSYSQMMDDAANENLTQEQYNEMMEDATQVQMACELDPRMSNSQAAGDAAGQILAFQDPNSADNGYSAYMNYMYTPDPSDPDGSQQAARVQAMNTTLSTGMTSLTSYSNNLPTEMQQYMQMIQQAGNTMQSCTTKTADTTNYIISKSN